MILLADVGNTHIKISIYDGDNIAFQGRFVTDKLKTSDEYLVELYTVLRIYKIKLDRLDGVVISSVVPQVTGNLKSALKKITKKEPLIIGPGIKTGLNIKIDNPATLGADMVCGCVAAAELFDSPSIIFSLGTATAVFVIGKDKAMLGGCIMPGVSLALNALTKTSSLLPEISLEKPEKVIGKNTEDCMRSGSVIGTAAMIDGMIERIEEELSENCTVIATGGIAPMIVPSCKRKIILCENLIMDGMKIIYYKNRNKN